MARFVHVPLSASAWMCWQPELHVVPLGGGFDRFPLSLSQKGKASLNMVRSPGAAARLDCRAHREILKMGAWDLSVRNCPGLCMNKSPTALRCAVDQCGFVPGKGLYLCLFMSFYFTPYFLSFFFLFHSCKTHTTFTQMVIQQFPVQIIVAALILFYQNVGKSRLELLVW